MATTTVSTRSTTTTNTTTTTTTTTIPASGSRDAGLKSRRRLFVFRRLWRRPRKRRRQKKNCPRPPPRMAIHSNGRGGLRAVFFLPAPPLEWQFVRMGAGGCGHFFFCPHPPPIRTNRHSEEAQIRDTKSLCNERGRLADPNARRFSPNVPAEEENIKPKRRAPGLVRPRPAFGARHLLLSGEILRMP